jgi:hypothetical protein
MRRLLLLLLLLPVFSRAQKLPTIEEKTKDLEKKAGYLSFYWEEGAGKLWLEIDKPGTEMLYYTSMPAAIGSNDIGLDRGRLADIRIIKFQRTGKKLLMVQPNYDYRAVTRIRLNNVPLNNLSRNQHSGDLPSKRKAMAAYSLTPPIFYCGMLPGWGIH